MIAKVLVFLTLLGVALSDNPLAGVDPNTLQCDPAGQIHLLLPHFTECGKFYMCAHGQEVEFSCASPLIFHFELQTCNWDWATECVLRTLPSEDSDEGEGSTGEEGGSSDEEEGSGDESGDFEWAGFQDEPVQASYSAALRPAMEPAAAPRSNFAAILDCHSSAGAARQAPYKGDCQRYWRCVDGLPQSAYCSDGLFFNDQKQACDFEANVKCAINHEDELQGEFIVYQ